MRKRSTHNAITNAGSSLQINLNYVVYHPTKLAFIHCAEGVRLIVIANGPSIQLLGDWASLAALCYLTRPLDQRIKAGKLMACKCIIFAICIQF